MRRTIDFEFDRVPTLPNEELRHPVVVPGGRGADRLAGDDKYGFGNYGVIFRTHDQTPPPEPLEQVVSEMDSAGIELGVIVSGSNAHTAEVISARPDRFFGLCYINPFDGMRGVRELERLVREEGFKGLEIDSLYCGIPASDRRCYPLYAKCVELDIPVRIYTSMTYANDRPYDLGHPRHLDQIGIDFPELRMVAGLGGWPWVNEMVGILRRHPNLYLDTAAHRPKYFAQPGAGWDMLLQYGNTLLQDKIMVALSSGLLGSPFAELIAEYEELPLKDSVKDKWFHGNAARFLGLG